VGIYLTLIRSARGQEKLSYALVGPLWQYVSVEQIAYIVIDGGGIKGYCSLLVLKRLMSLVEEIETGQRRITLVRLCFLALLLFEVDEGLARQTCTILPSASL
jgi:hypothetical protein